MRRVTCPLPCLDSVVGVRLPAVQSPRETPPPEPFPLDLAVLCALLFPLALALGYMFRELAAL